MGTFNQLVNKLNELFEPVLAVNRTIEAVNEELRLYDWNDPKTSELYKKRSELWNALDITRGEARAGAEALGLVELGQGVTRIAYINPNFPAFVFKVEYQEYSTAHRGTNQKELKIYQEYPKARPHIARTYFVRGIVAVQERLFGRRPNDNEYIEAREQLEKALTDAGLRVNDLHSDNFMMTAQGPKALDMGGFYM